MVTLVLVSAFISWLSVDRAIRIPESSTWIVPMVSISLFVIFLCLSTVLLREKRTIFITLLIAFSFSLLFAFNPWHILVVLASFFLASWGFGNVRNDLGLNVKISLWKSLLTGKTQFIWGIALLISSQYYFTINSIDGQKNMPKLDINEFVVKYTIPVMGFVNPAFKNIDKEGLTVDEYLMSAQQNDSTDGSFGMVSGDYIDAQIPANIPPQQREILKQEAMKKMLDAQNNLSQKNKDLILAETRKQFSSSVGRDLKGNEKMSEVLAGIVGQKMNSILQTPLKGGGTIASMLPLIFSVILFLTIVPLASWFLSLIWFFLVIGIFAILVKTGLVTIGKEMTEKENIQY